MTREDRVNRNTLRQITEIVDRLREERATVRRWLVYKGMTELEARDIADLHRLGGPMVLHAVSAGF